MSVERVRRFRPGLVLDRDFLKNSSVLERLEPDGGLCLVERRDRSFIVRREGVCVQGACGAPCCRMLCLQGPLSRYLEGFAEQGAVSPVVRMNCLYLGPDLLCTRWAAPDFPEACRLFPLPGDRMYLEVMDVCAFRFVLVGEHDMGGPCD